MMPITVLSGEGPLQGLLRSNISGLVTIFWSDLTDIEWSAGIPIEWSASNDYYPDTCISTSAPTVVLSGEG